MKKIGIIYGSSGGATKKVADKLQQAFGKQIAELIDVKDATRKDVEGYENLILGTSAWGIGDVQPDWDNFIDELTEVNFQGKKVALFGLGDQKNYPDSFVDGMGYLYCRLPDKSVIVGQWPREEYDYYFSMAEIDGKLVGLALDEDTQPRKTTSRVNKWVEILRKEFN